MKKFLIMTAAYFAIIIAAALLPFLFIDKEHKVTVMEKKESVDNDLTIDLSETTPADWAVTDSQVPPFDWEPLPPDKHREVLQKENKDLHYLNILKSDIIEEIMLDNEALRALINECECREK